MSSRIRDLAVATGLALLLCGGAAAAACIAPTPPGTFPDGNTASKDDMIAGQKSVKDYLAQADAYMDCVTAETPKFDPKKPMSDKEKEALAATQAAAQKSITDTETQKVTVADRFNTQLKIWKARQAQAAPPAG